MSEYERHAHRVQTAIAALMALDPTYSEVLAKHMRTGIDMGRSDTAGLATLLIAKGIFTQDEYVAALTAAAEREADAYEKIVQATAANRNIRTV